MLGKTFLPFILAQSALRMVILGIVYSHEIVFTQLMTSDNVCCGINWHRRLFSEWRRTVELFIKFSQQLNATNRPKYEIVYSVSIPNRYK
jgi:hypothetical protein